MASSRSLKLSTDGKRQVDRSLTDKAWRDANLAEAIGASEQTAEKFRLGRNVDRTYFVKFCQALGLDWEAVAESESPSAPNSGGAEPVEESRSTTAENLQQNAPHAQGIQVQGSGQTIVGQTVNIYQGFLPQDSGTESDFNFTELDEKQIQQQCRGEILKNYSKIRLLSGQEIGVDQLYVDVWLLNRQPRTFQISESKMLETFDLRTDRLGLGDRSRLTSPGFDVANAKDKLLILGKPGAGKTTFLKHLAIDWCNGKFQPDLIAVFIEFRQIRDQSWRLIDAIGIELKIRDENQIKALLRDGKLLILMDGFDEVPTQDLRIQVQQQLAQVVRDYSRNRYIMTCRTQIMQRIPDNFNSVEVADFNIDQVQKFVHNWFQANGKNEPEIKLEWRNFKSAIDKNSALKELTSTPVLLGLMCLVLQDEGKIPSQAGLLYERGIRLLLRKWNDDKAIDGWEIGTVAYRNLDLSQKENLLIEIAARKFENPRNFVLFEQDDLLKQIIKYLHFENDTDARAVLKAIESQHGLLVERADELWSFSHLTFQEYFTTKWLLRLSPEELSQKTGDARWREVVQQIVKAQGQSDQLLRLIKQAIDYSLSDDDDLQKILVWVWKNTELICGPYKLTSTQSLYSFVDIRSFYFSLSLDCEHEHGYDRSRSSDRDFVRSLDLDQQLYRALFLSHELVVAPDANQARDLDHILSLARGSDRDSEFTNKLKEIRMKLPKASRSNRANDFEKWWKVDGQGWRFELQQAMIKYRNIGHDWQLSGGQNQKLKRYHEANKFLVELLKIKNSVSPEARQEIEDNLLLPIVELKRRLPDQYGRIEES
jgi:predicted NACHT family NTPase